MPKNMEDSLIRRSWFVMILIGCLPLTGTMAQSGGKKEVPPVEIVDFGFEHDENGESQKFYVSLKNRSPYVSYRYGPYPLRYDSPHPTEEEILDKYSFIEFVLKDKEGHVVRIDYSLLGFGEGGLYGNTIIPSYADNPDIPEQERKEMAKIDSIRNTFKLSCLWPKSVIYSIEMNVYLRVYDRSDFTNRTNKPIYETTRSKEIFRPKHLKYP